MVGLIKPTCLPPQVVQPGRHNRLLPKIYVNLGITQEADGRLHAACDNYRCFCCRPRLPPAYSRMGVHKVPTALMTSNPARPWLTWSPVQGGHLYQPGPLPSVQAARERAVRARRPDGCRACAAAVPGHQPQLRRRQLRPG